MSDQRLIRAPLTYLIAMVSLALLLASTTVAQAGEYNPVLNIGDRAPEWSKLPGVDGKKHSLSDLKAKDVVVVVFTCNSCPYAVDYEDRLVAFARQHATKDSKVAINVNKVPEDLPDEMAKRAKAKGFTFPYLFDESQEIAKEFGAGATPEFFVLNRDRRIVYMGAMDDSPNAKKVTRRYIEEAVNAALASKQPEVKETVPIGYRIRFERRRRRK
jgi:peroxiredoxin